MWGMRLCVAALLTVAAVAGCGGDDEGDSPARPDRTQVEKPAAEAPRRDESHALEPPPCPPDLGNCRRAGGTIAYVERVDPDGDGDAHFVLLSGESITAPGLTVIDVRKDLRPHPLPGPGAELAAAGPVYPGSRGQLQIEAVAVRTR